MTNIKKENNIKQQRFFSKTLFAFKEDGFDYIIKDRSGSRSMFIKYLDLRIGSEYQVMEKSEYFRNLGIIWSLLSLMILVLGGGNFILWGSLGVICLGVYFFYSTEYIVFPGGVGNVFVIKDTKANLIIGKIIDGFKKAAITEYGSIDYSRTFEEEKAKYRQLLSMGVIQEVEFNDKLREMEQNVTKFPKKQ